MRRVILILTILFLASCSYTGVSVRKEDRDLHLARKFRRQGDEIRAAIFYLKVLDKHAKFVEGLKFMYKFYRRNKDLQHSFEYLLRLSEVEPENPEWHYQIGLILLGDNDRKDGCKELRLALRFSRGKMQIPDKYKEVCGR